MAVLSVCEQEVEVCSEQGRCMGKVWEDQWKRQGDG